jgi:signal peptidase I
MEKTGKKTDFARELFDWAQSLANAFVCIVLLFAFAFSVFSVSQNSMTDTLQDGEMVVVSRLPYTPAYADIILFVKPGWPDSFNDSTGQYNPLVKRIIGLPGDVIDFRDGKMFINDVELQEGYIRDTLWTWKGNMSTPLTVPEDCVFVMGDNRNGSHDSRMSDIGFVDRRSVLGRVVLRLTPLKKFGPVA